MLKSHQCVHLHSRYWIIYGIIELLSGKRAREFTTLWSRLNRSFIPGLFVFSILRAKYIWFLCNGSLMQTVFLRSARIRCTLTLLLAGVWYAHYWRYLMMTKVEVSNIKMVCVYVCYNVSCFSRFIIWYISWDSPLIPWIILYFTGASKIFSWITITSHNNTEIGMYVWACVFLFWSIAYSFASFP